MDKKIIDYDAVLNPALTDYFICQQAGVTKKQTAAQILSNISNMSAATALDGSEITVCRQSGINRKMTISALATYIIGEL
jgi:hypothetical protein